jgi:hypothetical protein
VKNITDVLGDRLADLENKSPCYLYRNCRNIVNEVLGRLSPWSRLVRISDSNK